MVNGLDPIVAGLVVGAILLLIGWFFAMAKVGTAAKRQRRRRLQSAAAGPFDELWHPLAHNARVVWEAQQEMVEPGAVPDDEPFPDSRITIRVVRAEHAAGTTDG